MKVTISKSNQNQNYKKEFNRYKTGLNNKFNKYINAINKILYSTRLETTNLIKDYKEYRLYSV